jgi:hypothetical protein
VVVPVTHIVSNTVGILVRTDQYRGRARGRDVRAIIVGRRMIYVVTDRMINVVTDRMIIVVTDWMVNVVTDIRKSSGA